MHGHRKLIRHLRRVAEQEESYAHELRVRGWSDEAIRSLWAYAERVARSSIWMPIQVLQGIGNRALRLGPNEMQFVEGEPPERWQWDRCPIDGDEHDETKNSTGCVGCPSYGPDCAAIWRYTGRPTPT